MRRLFLHTLARFGSSGALFVARERTRAFIGVAASVGAVDMVFVPLAGASGTLGVLALGVDGKPPAQELAELSAFGDVVTRLLESERALAAARRQSRDSDLLAMVNERLHKSLDRADVLQGIVEGVRSAFKAERCMVYERSPDGEGAAVVAAAAAHGLVPTARHMDLEADLRKVFGGLTVRRDDISGGNMYGSEARSATAIPFVVDGRVEDALVLSFDRPSAFDDADVAALRSLAFNVGLALSNARLYERERTRRLQAETLERVVRILRDTQYVDEVLLVFVVTVSHELPLDCVAYAIEGPLLQRRALRLRDQRGGEPALTLERAMLEPFLAVDEPSDAALLPRPARDGLFDGREGVVIPLRIEGTLWGCFVVRAAEGPLEWPQDQRATFFRTLGSHLEIALANAHAYERELRRGQERETLAEAARAILSHTAIGTLADVMSRLAASLVHCERSCVLRWDGERYSIAGSFGEEPEQIVERSGFDVVHRAERVANLTGDERRTARAIDGPGYAVIPLAQNAGGADTTDAFLIVSGEPDARFTRDDLRLLQELAALLSLALRNLDLYEAMRLANRALHESSEFKDDLLAMLAHDFKGPLTVILGYCGLLLEGSNEGREEIETVYAQTERLVRLSEDALVLAQTQSEGFSLARTVVDLGNFVTDCVEATAAQDARLRVNIAAEPLPVELDPQRFRHVMDNLVSNALKYSEGDVTVAVCRDDTLGVIQVSDRGIGIPEGELMALFSRFSRASNARERGIKGTGIGLYVAKKIVDVHRGTIVVRSKENEGSTFIVSLPLVPS